MGTGILKDTKTIIFDYGCVISKPQNEKCILSITNKLGLKHPDEFKKLYSIHRKDIDSGMITLKEYWVRTLNEINLTLSEDDMSWLIKEDIMSWADINEETIKLIKELKNKKYKLAILSNMVTETLDYLEKNTTFIGLFDYQFFSCNINMVKPNPEIYRYVLKQMKMEGQKCIFIDDLLINCEEAGKHGIYPIHYTGILHLKSELRKVINWDYQDIKH
jgi:putative hydrolase of the HAD superfamily